MVPLVTNNKKRHGFTLVEMLFVLSILLILGYFSFNFFIGDFFAKTRDQERIESLNAMRDALALYYSKYNHYPAAPSATGHEFDYHTGENCDINAPARRYDNGSSGTGITLPYAQAFKDPLSAKYQFSKSIWNCRYVIPATSLDAVDDPRVPANPDDQWWEDNFPQYDEGRCTQNRCASPYTWPEIQSYYIHCPVEEPNEASINDGGYGPFQEYFYEVFEPNPWVCLNGVPNEAGTGTDFNPPTWFHE